MASAVVKSKQQLSNILTQDAFQRSLADVMPKHLTPERIVKMVLVAASKNPLIFKCTDASIYQAVMAAGELGLDCSGTTGQGYVVPYWSNKKKSYEAQFIPGYQGLIDLARRSGHVLDINPVCVYWNDAFSIDFGREQVISHSPYLDGDRGKPKCYYAIAWLRDNPRPHVEFMTKSDVDSIKEMTKSRNKKGEIVGPWKDHPVEMSRKTVVRRITKYLPKSPELQQAIEIDNHGYVDSSAIEVSLAEPTVSEITERISKPAQIEEEQPDPAPVKQPEKPVEAAAEALPAAQAMRPDTFDALEGCTDRDLANHVYLQALAAGWTVDGFIKNYDVWIGKGQSPQEALASMKDKFDKGGK